MTAVQTKHDMDRDPKWWKIPLMDFVDDFRYHRDMSAIADAFDLSDERKDAVLASVIETLCDELEISIPSWLSTVPACREPYFMSGMQSLKAISLVETPVRFRLRKIFVMENVLHRV